jgi:predicted RNA-binding Zn-ribbon protein involved in translation (DUF1610 family)
MVKIPNSMDELVYFTKRTYGDVGRVTAWAHKSLCPKCKKGMMGKPLDPKTKRPKIRALEYECPECGHTIEKKAYEDTLTLEATYTCKKCKKTGEVSMPFKRKSTKVTNEETGKISSCPAFVFPCEHCQDKIVITKKMKGE